MCDKIASTPSLRDLQMQVVAIHHTPTRHTERSAKARSEVSKPRESKKLVNQYPKSELTTILIKVSDSRLIRDSPKWILRYTSLRSE